jgi:hypothetical protein
MLRRNKVTRIGELGTTLAVTSNRRTLRRNTKNSNICCILLFFVTLMMEALSSCETSAHTRPARSNIREDAIRHSPRR